jgi:ribose transport system substrate-binding protein
MEVIVKRQQFLTRILAPAMSLALMAGALPQTVHVQARSAQAAAINVSFVIADGADPFYLTMKCGATAAAKASNVNLNWQGPAAVDFQPELTTLNAVMQLHPQGLVLAPFDPNAFIQPVQQAMKAGIPVVTVDGSLSKPVEYENIRTNNIKAGHLAADALGQAIGGKGKILIVALSPGVTANTERATGFAAEIKAKFPNISLLPIQYPGGDANKASQDVAAAIQGNPDLKGVYTTYAIASNAAASAILTAHKRGQIKLVAYDADPNEVNELKTGVFDALVVQNPYQEGFDSVTLVAKLVRHQISPSAVKYQAYPTSYIATRANINAPWLQKYLYKVTC